MRPHDTANGVVRIPLHSHKYPGLYALVDEADAELALGYRWFPSKTRNGFYAVAWDFSVSPKNRIFLHHLIAGHPGPNRHTDHANGDGLDNRRQNLRHCTYAQNQANRRVLMTGASSAFRGVTWSKSHKKWQAQIGHNGTTIYLGMFDVEEDAALSYDIAARLLFGEFAWGNAHMQSPDIDHLRYTRKAS